MKSEKLIYHDLSTNHLAVLSAFICFSLNERGPGRNLTTVSIEMGELGLGNGIGYSSPTEISVSLSSESESLL